MQTNQTKKPDLNYASQLLLDYLMNEPIQQENMEAYVKDRFKFYGYDLDDLHKRSGDPITGEATEDSPEYNLYYSLTTEWHSKVLAKAILLLTGVIV
jgi:hypothetical protein